MRLILTFVAALSAAGVQAEVAVPNAAATIVAGLETAWNTADGPAWGRLFWDDADSVNIYGHTLHGGVAMGARHAIVWAGRAKGTKLHIDIRDFRQVDDKVAIIDMVQNVDRPTQPDARKIVVYVTSILQRRGGEWRIVHVQNTSITDPPAE